MEPPVLELESQELELFAAPEPECIQDPAPNPEMGPDPELGPDPITSGQQSCF